VAKNNPISVKESLVRDVCNDQKARGLEPTHQAAEEYWKETLERVDKKAAVQERKAKAPAPAPAPAPGSKKAGMDRQLRKLGVSTDYEVTTREAVPEAAPEEEAQSFLEQAATRERELLLKRMKLLKSKPELRVQIECLALAVTGMFGPGKQGYAIHELERIIERSNAVFGDWRKEPVPTLYFGGGK
jgi:hypothetical protein